MCGLRTGREGERIFGDDVGGWVVFIYSSYINSCISLHAVSFRALFPDPKHLQLALDQNLAPLRYVDDANNITQVTTCVCVFV